jgi:hypothetical protein
MAAHPKVELATEDLLIERPDLGRGCSTLVAKGDPIPPAFAGLPRRPLRPGPPKRRRT